MIKNSEREQNDWLSKFLKRVNEEPQRSPEEIAQSKAEREQAVPVKYLTVRKDEDGSIIVKMNQYGPSQIVACGEHTFEPGGDGHEQALQDYSYLKPGESRTIIKKLINGEWIVQKPDKQNDVA